MNRDDFLEIVYNELRDDPTNDRANRIIDAFDSVDAVEVIRCKNCIYYHKPHIEKDGVEYDYSEMPKEAFGLIDRYVTMKYGINIGGKCEYEKNSGYEVDKSVFRTENDYCSRGERKEE